MNPLSRTPFFFLLIALIGGILLQYYGQNITWSIIVFLAGGSIILLSYLLKKDKQYTFRWLFGAGTFLLFVAAGTLRTYTKQDSLDFVLSDTIQTYIGYVKDTPQEKPRSVACKIHLEKEDRDVVCYLQKDRLKMLPAVGDQIIFKAKLQPFKNRGNPNDFDYERYMYNSGFVGMAYLPSSSWLATGKQHQSLFVQALQLRQSVMNLFASLDFTDEQQAILSALTLGYQDTLSDDLKQGFRTTGTVHVLSVSGLHVGIIYGMIAFLLSFVPLRRRYYWIKPVFVIFLLWVYSFITGLPPSVVRASTMLTMFCVAEVFDRKHSPLNNLFIAAFFMLLYNPFQFFDIGFQLSCISVLSILILHPIFVKKVDTKNKVWQSVWSLISVSLAAQLAAFPLCLYYFGTFPSYFFIANLLIVPMVSFITYGVILLVGLWKVLTLISYGTECLWILVKMLQGLIGGMTWFIHTLEKLPFALIENIEVSFLELFMIYAIIISLVVAIRKSDSLALKMALVSAIILLISNIYDQVINQKERYLMVMNQPDRPSIHYKVKGSVQLLDSLLLNEKNPIIELQDYNMLIVNQPTNNVQNSLGTYKVDYALVISDQLHTLAELEQLYSIDTLILSGALKNFTRIKLTKECENRAIPVYDVSKKGAFRINF